MKYEITEAEMELLLRAKEARRRGNEYRKARRQRPDVKLAEAARREARRAREKQAVRLMKLLEEQGTLASLAAQLKNDREDGE